MSFIRLSGAAGASPAFKQKELAVVGGGDTAVEEALYLTKYGKHVRAPHNTCAVFQLLLSVQDV